MGGQHSLRVWTLVHNQRANSSASGDDKLCFFRRRFDTFFAVSCASVGSVAVNAVERLFKGGVKKPRISVKVLPER